MLIEAGDKLHVVTRRLFEGDIRRHFVGEVEETTNSAVRAAGFAFVFDMSLNQFVRRPERRVRILSLVDSGLIINLLPRGIVVEELRYQASADNRTIVTDGRGFRMDIHEFGSKR